MEKLLCKLIAVFLSIGLAVSAQANFIVNDSSELKAVAKGTYFSLDKAQGWSSSYYKGGGEAQLPGKLNASPFSGNVLSIFQDVTAAAKPAYDVSFENEARQFERERFNFGLDASSSSGNLLGRVKVNTHVPESTSLMLFAVGLFSLAMARRKMKA